jgi:GWxTD domain-containing protein
MAPRRSPNVILFVLALLATQKAWAGLDKEAKKWLDGVAPLILLEERKLYEGLKDKADIPEFQRIFWARRDPDLATPENEYQAQYQKAFSEAEQRFRARGRSGAENDCGRVFILLGEPTSAEKGTPPDGGLGLRTPETWTYKGPMFTGGQAVIAFDEACMGPPREDFRKQIDRIAESRILNPNIDYRFGKDGHLTKLADLLPKPTPAQALLKSPRQDFSVATQTYFLKAQDGSTALLGLVRGDAAGMPIEEAGGKRSVKAVICAQAANDAGNVVAFADQETNAEATPDGAFVASFKMGLKPGKYEVTSGALDTRSGKGSVTSTPVDVPDFNTGELAATLLIVRDIQPVDESSADSTGAYAAFSLGKFRLVPHLGTSFAKADTISFFYQYYDAKLDDQTKKASVVVTVSVLKGPVPQARAGDQFFEMALGGNAVGPIPLADFAAGSYRVQLKVVDNLAKKEVTRELPFDVK